MNQSLKTPETTQLIVDSELAHDMALAEAPYRELATRANELGLGGVAVDGSISNSEYIAETEPAQQLYNDYEAFRDDIAHLVDEFHGGGYHNTGFRDHEQFIGNGDTSGVFIFDKDDKRYVAKVPLNGRSEQEYRGAIEQDAPAWVRAKDLPHYEQVVAASVDGTVVSEYVPGDGMSGIASDTLRLVTADQITEYVHATMAGHEAGIVIDPKPDNVLYHPEHGFTIIDFSNIDSNLVRQEYKDNPAIALVEGLGPLLAAGYGKNGKLSIEEQSALAKLQLPLVEAYAIAVEHELDEQYHGLVLPKIQEAVDSLRLKADLDAYKEHIAATEAAWLARKRSHDPVKDKVDAIL